MADLPAILLASLNPDTRRQAEHSLGAISVQPGFLSHLLRLVLDTNQDRAVRLAGSIYLKNVAMTRWEEDLQPLAEQDKAALRAELVPAMLALSGSTDKSIRVQVAESVSLIAQLDFPHKWSDLIDQLVSSLSETDYNANIGVLHTAHSIFRLWRSQVRSDQLFTEINLVLSKFMTPFLHLFRQTASLLLTNPSPNPSLTTPVGNYALLAQAMVSLVEILFDFTCQDLPPAIEDAAAEFFTPQTGWLQAFMSWDPPDLRVDPDEPTPSLPSQVKAGILEIVELFIKLYPEQLQQVKAVESFVQAVWLLIGSNNLPGLSGDSLVSGSLRFLSTAIRSGFYKDLFSSRDTITSLTQGVVVPNIALREHDVEQFEDDPLDFIRLDLALSSGAGGDAVTRRLAAADVLQALVSSGFEAETTDIVGTWIAEGLREYESDKENKWKAKDSAVFLLMALATRGATTQHGVTSTNTLVDVVKFFSDHVYEDLQAQPGTVHPIIQADAIRFLYTFRNQMTKPQLLAVLPVLARQLRSKSYVIYTYAAITIERILSIKQGDSLIFSQVDIHAFSADLVSELLLRIEAGGTAQKVAENDHLMKCTMRVIFVARHSLMPIYQRTLRRLMDILGLILNNSSNPRFEQFIFESISGLMRFIVEKKPDALPTFEEAMFGPFTVILNQGVDQYMPYVFQILGQMLELHTDGVPKEYRDLIHPILQPPIWQPKGNIPGLVKLFKAYLVKDSKHKIVPALTASVLAVVQQRLIPSKMNDVWGFELLQSTFVNVWSEELKPLFTPIIVTLLTRMQTNKTESFVYQFTRFLLLTLSIRDGIDPDIIIESFEEIQPKLWSQVLERFVIPTVPNMTVKDRKIAAIGLTRLLTGSSKMLQEPSVMTWPATFAGLVKLFNEPQHLTKSTKTEEDPNAIFTEIDFEEQTAGYQAAFSRLAASEYKDPDPVEYIHDPHEFLGQELARLYKTHGTSVKSLIEAANAGPFVRALPTSGYTLV